MINKVIIVGRLVADPEVRYTQDGTAIASFRVAVERSFKNKNGEKQTDFINCVAWKKLGALVGQFCTKGKMVACDGSLQQKNWEQEGVKRTSYEVNCDNVQFLNGKQDDMSGGNQSQQESHQGKQNNTPNNETPDLPF